MSATMTDRKFAIYSFSVRFTQDGGKSGDRDADLPEGRIRNSVHTTRMYREDPGIEEAERWARDEWWPEYLKQEPRFEGMKPVGELNPADMTFEVKHDRDEEWAGGWFGHWTFDDGQTDAEVLESFEQFVRRMQRMIREEGHEAYCLMGAEDRWRWKLCRCEHCKAQGVIRIDH